MLDRQLIEDIANRLRVGGESLIEKDWHVVRAIRVLAELDHGGARPVFSGGTSLSIGWGLIKRFSEDVDFKVAMPEAATPSKARTLRSAYRNKIITALGAADFELAGTPLVGNKSTYFAADFSYPSEFGPGPGLRPNLRIEMTFQTPALDPVERPIRSLVAQAQGHEPEVRTFFCVDPVETAADKLSALAWRVCVRERGGEDDDPTIIRHLHDLAALESRAIAVPAFVTLVANATTADKGRGGNRVPENTVDRFLLMLEKLRNDRLWANEYDEFVHNVSFSGPGETISFNSALDATERLVELYRKRQ